jgi:hypothetical protein
MEQVLRLYKVSIILDKITGTHGTGS